MSLLSFLRPAGPVPLEYRHNFRHLYMDVAWYGVLSVSALAFVGVYVARQGGSAFQVGLLTAGPAVANLLVAIPIGRWLQKRAIGRAVFWSSVANRLFYVLWIPLPFLLAPSAQVWTLIGLTIAMSIPGASLAIGFNSMFAEAVPSTWRGYVAGIRNALLAVASVLGSLICGTILTGMAFPSGYQVVFAIGTIAAFMSSFHLWSVRPPARREAPPRPTPPAPVADARAGQVNRDADARPATPARPRLHAPALRLQRTEILSGPFGKVLLALFVFHISQYLTVPVIPVYMVRELHLQDQQIGLATAVFWLFSFGGSLLLANLAEQKGHKWVTAIGAILMGAYPGFMALSGGFGMTTVLVASGIGGIGYALMSGAFLNYILERVPHGDRPPYLAWYNIAFNAAILIGALLGPFAAGRVGFAVALGLFAASRVVAGLFILTRG